jgi:hypothetical protein
MKMFEKLRRRKWARHVVRMREMKTTCFSSVKLKGTDLEVDGE